MNPALRYMLTKLRLAARSLPRAAKRAALEKQVNANLEGMGYGG